MEKEARTKSIDMAGLSNLYTDIIVSVGDGELEKLGVKKGSWTSAKKVDGKILEEVVRGKERRVCYAGSPANTVFNCANLGLATMMFGSLGQDEIGRGYREELQRAGIKQNIASVCGKSGMIYALISLDGERTFIAEKGVAGNFGFDYRDLKDVRLLHTSAYELETNKEVTKRCIKMVKENGGEISFDMAGVSSVRSMRGEIENILGDVDIMFITEEEAEEFGGESPYKVFKKLSKVCGKVALKKGACGSSVREGCREYHIPIYETKVVTTCGAGDGYAAGFLFGYLKDFSIKGCGEWGSEVASNVCGIIDSHL